MDDQNITPKPPKNPTIPWLIITLGAVALFIAAQLNNVGSSAYIFGKYVGKLISFILFLGIPTFAIAKLARKPMTTALRIFAWLFLAACLFDYFPLLVKLSYSTTTQNPPESNTSSVSSLPTELESILSQSRRSTSEEVISFWDPKLSLEQRGYRLWMDSLSIFLSSLGDQSALDKLSSLDGHLDKLRDAQDRIKLTLKNFLPIWEQYGAELKSTIKDEFRLSRFRIKWRSYIESVTIYYTYDNEAFSYIISYLRFLRTNRSKYYFLDGEIQSDDDNFVQELAAKLSTLDNPEAEAAQEQRRNQAILDYAKALDIAKGKE